MNTNPLKEVYPQPVWDFFYTLSQIPRCSTREAAAIEWVKAFADERGLEWETDKTGNISVRKPASPGMEKKRPVVIQGHIDMVCEKNQGTEHDFGKDPITLIRDGEWLRADGTTLGADNGIAVAIALAVLDDRELQHGPVEALFTVDEESGLTGASNLDPAIVRGKILLNLDTEELGAFYIGCAGGVTSEGFVPVTTEDFGEDRAAMELTIRGLRGGHSGAEIHLGLGNSLVLCGRFLREAGRKSEIRLISVNGGNKHNVIPRECAVQFSVPSADVEQVNSAVNELAALLKEELGDIEPALSIELKDVTLPEEEMDKGSTERIIKLMRVMPHGVYGMSRTIEGLVETSSNFAAMETQNGCCSTVVRILTSQRSSVMSALDDVAGRVIAAIELSGGQVRQLSRYPAWTPDPDSPLLATCKRVYSALTGSEASHAAIHAGLECGVIGAKIEGMEMISFGPELNGVHTPEEKMHIGSVASTWDFLKSLLKEL